MKIGPFEFRLNRRAQPVGDNMGNGVGWDRVGTVETMAGILVSNNDAIAHSTVFSCINVIAEGVAMLPLQVMRENDGARYPAKDHPLYELLLTAPNPHMTAFDFWKLVIFEKLNQGNHYSLVVRDNDGRVVELVPVENGSVMPFWYLDNRGARRRAYRVSAPSGGMAVFMEDEIFHVQNLPKLRGVGYGLKGYSVWELYLNETLGGAVATENFANGYFANGASLSGMISVDAPLSAETSKALRQEVTEAYRGKHHEIGVFGSNAKYNTMSSTAKDAQMLESRKFNRSVIAGILRVSAHLINDLEKATFSNIEQLDIGHYKHCLLPHLVHLRQTAKKDLLLPNERSEYYLDHDPSEMLRGDQKTWSEVLEKGVQNARLTPNEARAMDNRPPKPGGDVLLINSASVPLDMAGKQQQDKTKENVDGGSAVSKA